MLAELSQVFPTNNYPTLNRHNKDFASYEKEQIYQKKQILNEKQDRRQRLADEAYELFRQKMPSEVTDYKVIEKIKQEVMKERPYLTNLNGVQLRNPLTQKIIGRENEDLNDKFVPNQLFQAKQKNCEVYEMIQERSKNELNQMQCKKRGGENYTKYMTHTEDQQILMQGKKKTEFSQKMREQSEQQIQMQSKKRPDNESQNIQKQSTEERQLFCGKKRVPDYHEKYLNKSENYEVVQHKLRNVGIESYDFPLSSPVIQRADQPKEAQLFQRKNLSKYSNLNQATNDNQQLFQGKRRLQQDSFNKYMQKTEDEQPLMQGKGKNLSNVNLQQQKDQIQLMQCKRRVPDAGKMHQRSNEEQQLFSSKKRVNVPDQLDFSNTQQVLFLFQNQFA